MNDGSKFSNGFLLGLMLGGAAVFLFGTKTGKKLLKIVSEEGFKGISDLIEEELDSRLDLNEEGDEEAQQEESEPRGNGNGHHEKAAVPKRKFFRRRS